MTTRADGTYVIEPPRSQAHDSPDPDAGTARAEAPTSPPERPTTILQRIDQKLDRILSGAPRPADSDDSGDIVTFEPDPDPLPVEDDASPDDTPDPTGQGEGTANTHDAARPRFGFPGRRSRVDVE